MRQISNLDRFSVTSSVIPGQPERKALQAIRAASAIGRPSVHHGPGIYRRRPTNGHAPKRPAFMLPVMALPLTVPLYSSVNLSGSTIEIFQATAFPLTVPSAMDRIGHRPTARR